MYNQPLYRPPSEGNSAIIQATLGCSHNRCTFCSMYKTKKFSIRDETDLFNHTKEIAKYYPRAKKVFIADGNALAMPFDIWMQLLGNIKKLFPSCQRISTYATPKDLLRKSFDQLLLLKQSGLDLLYMGIESGNENVLIDICKGATSNEIVLAGQKAIKAGFQLSVTIIAGLGSKNYLDHAIDTAKVINQIQPQYLGVLSLMVEQHTKLFEAVRQGTFILPSTFELLDEMRLLISNLDLENTIFRSNHASNYLTLAGVLNKDRLDLIQKINYAISHPDILRPENFRSL